MELFIKCGSRYKPAPRSIVTETAAKYAERITGELCSPTQLAAFLNDRLKYSEREHFACVFLDNRHRVIEFKIMFSGTIGESSVHPREVVKRGLAVNAAAVVFAHNHPSGEPEPSEADKQITYVLKEALKTVDIRVLDHFVIGCDSHVSFAERGLL